MRKWFTIGFCAWLAGLGESGGQFNFNFRSGHRHSSGHGPSFRDMMDQAGEWIAQNLYWIIPVTVALVIFGLAVGLVLTWFNSRGKFMFLHCVALDVAEVKRPWHELGSEANSLFWFRLVLGLIGLASSLPVFGGLVFVIGRMLYYEQAETGAIATAVALALVLLALGICFVLIQKFTIDFVVPIMFLRRVGCIVAWREFLALLQDNVGRFTLYVLFQILLTIAIGFIVLGVVLVTCCTAGCLLIVPYIGTVVLLPVLVFKRSYSIYYLAQFGPSYDVFPPVTGPEETVVAS
jgi:hypothetical protein